MRILHTEWSDGWGGQERRILSEAQGLAARGHQLWIATRPQCRLIEEARRCGVPVLEVPIRGRFDARSIGRLARLMRELRVQVVNTHSGIDTWAGSLAARLARVPVLVRTRHLDLPLRRHWLNFVHYLPDAVISCGEHMRSHLIQSGFPAPIVTSIPTGVDFSRFSSMWMRPELHGEIRGKLRRDLDLPQDAFLVLMVGVIRGVKRHEIALRALHLLRGRIPQAHLALAGEGPMRIDMERLAAQLGIEAAVRFLGQREDVPDLMQAADALLLTSRSEGVPQAVTQAMGMGLPVVATAVGGVPELINDGDTGLLIPPEDPEAAALALARLHSEPDLAERLAGKACERARSAYSLDAMLDRTEQLYRELLGSRA